MSLPPSLKAVKTLLRDARAALVALVVVATPVLAVWAIHGEIKWTVDGKTKVTAPAWVLIVALGIAVGSGLALDYFRHRERERRLRLEGQLTEARQSLPQGRAERQLSGASRGVLATITSLRDTVNRRTAIFTGSKDTLVPTPDEIFRFKKVIAVVRLYFQGTARDIDETLTYFEPRPQDDWPSVSVMLSGLDEMETEVRTHGLTDSRDRLVRRSGSSVIFSRSRAHAPPRDDPGDSP